MKVMITVLYDGPKVCYQPKYKLKLGTCMRANLASCVHRELHLVYTRNCAYFLRCKSGIASLSLSNH